MKSSILVVVENALIFANSCAGTIMQYMKENSSIHIILLSSNEYKLIFTNHEYTSNVCIEDWNLRKDLSVFTRNACERLACSIRSIRPDFIITHSKSHFKGDDIALQIVLASHAVATAAGIHCKGLPITTRRIPIFGIEPIDCTSNEFIPDIFVDITLEEEENQKMMKSLLFSEKQLLMAKKRDMLHGENATKNGRKGCKYAEGFNMFNPVCNYNSFIW